MKKHIKSILVLVSISAVVAVLLALTNYITAPIIEENNKKNANAALFEVLPDGESFELVDVSSYTLPASVSEVYKAKTGGYVVKLTTTGYSSGMVIMCGISPEGTIVGSKIVTSNETPAIGGTAAETFASASVGKDATSVGDVDTVSGATKTTEAYRNALKDALNTALILGGASVDIRTEEEILNDNLSEALAAAEGKFTKYFFAQTVEGIDAIYSADNGAGHVCVIGEQFIAIDKAGTVLTACSDSDAQKVKNAIDVISATKTTDVDITAYEGLPTQLISVKTTESGNYIVEIKGVGYGILGGDEYHPASGEYIIIRVSMTAEGKIIDCITLKQAETDRIGSACADESFYSQFDGKTEADYSNITAISGATITTNGYKQAILRAFETVKIIEGGKNQ